MHAAGAEPRVLIENTNTVTLEAVDFFSPEPDECLIQVPPVSGSGAMRKDAQVILIWLILLSLRVVNGSVPGVGRAYVFILCSVLC